MDAGSVLDQGRGAPPKYTEYPYPVLLMSTRTISITEVAYQRLVREKQPGEGFTEVILRLTERRSLRDLPNIVSKEEADALAAAIDERREDRRALRSSQSRAGGSSSMQRP